MQRRPVTLSAWVTGPPLHERHACTVLISRTPAGQALITASHDLAGGDNCHRARVHDRRGRRPAAAGRVHGVGHAGEPGGRVGVRRAHDPHARRRAPRGRARRCRSSRSGSPLTSSATPVASAVSNVRSRSRAFSGRWPIRRPVGWLRQRTAGWCIAWVTRAVSSRRGVALAGVERELHPVELGEHVVGEVEAAVGEDVALDPAEDAERGERARSRPRSPRPAGAGRRRRGRARRARPACGRRSPGTRSRGRAPPRPSRGRVRAAVGPGRVAVQVAADVAASSSRPSGGAGGAAARAAPAGRYGRPRSRKTRSSSGASGSGSSAATYSAEPVARTSAVPRRSGRGGDELDGDAFDRHADVGLDHRDDLGQRREARPRRVRIVGGTTTASRVALVTPAPRVAGGDAAERRGDCRSTSARARSSSSGRRGGGAGALERRDGSTPRSAGRSPRTSRRRPPAAASRSSAGGADAERGADRGRAGSRRSRACGRRRRARARSSGAAPRARRSCPSRRARAAARRSPARSRAGRGAAAGGRARRRAAASPRRARRHAGRRAPRSASAPESSSRTRVLGQRRGDLLVRRRRGHPQRA